MRVTFLLLLLLCATWPGMPPRAWAAGNGTAEEEPPALSGYAVSLEGVEGDLRDLLLALSTAQEKHKEPVATAGLLRKRADDDLDRFRKALLARGRLNAVLNATLDLTQASPTVRFQIQPGPVFTLTRVDYSLLDQPQANASQAFPAPEAVGLVPGQPFQAALVLEARDRLVHHLKRHGFPYAQAEKPRILADAAAPTTRVEMAFTAGPRLVFGQTRFQGLTTVSPEFLASEPPWKPGDLYNADLVKELETRLARRNLFGAIGARPAEAPNADGSVDVLVDLGERKHRTIQGGVAWKSDLGPGASLGWEHRNLLGAGETLRLEVDASQPELGAEITYVIPKFHHPRQQLKNSLAAQDRDTAAFKARDAKAQALLERKVGERWTVSGGVAAQAAEVSRDEARPEEDNLRYALASLPMALEYDSRDNALDPTRGLRWTLGLEPYASVSQASLSSPVFFKAETSARAFALLLDSPRLVLAGKAGLGAWFGLPGEELPSVLRFYTGGGGSVRGFRYQTCGPTRGENPLGGAYLAELAAELRLNITESFGVVPFIDGGNVYDAAADVAVDGLLWAGGLGLRYNTPIGPLRLDFAVPFARRDGVDDRFQIYASVGQAF